jgi:hypothetical protein
MTPGTNDYPVQFTIQPNAALDRTDLSGVDLRVHIHGPYVLSGFIATSGKSWVTLPSFTASFANRAVQLSVDDPSFAQPVATALNGGAWSVVVPTPEVGRHTIYARASQGFDTSAAVSSVFLVKR